MTLEEAIEHAEELSEKMFDNTVYIMDNMKSDVALCNAERCRKCAEENKQLAEWLKDYKRLRELTDWTKCSDNLPNMDVDVLGTRKDNGNVVKIARMETYYGNAGWEWVLTDDIEANSYYPDEIIAWMPLPESYKAAKED